MDVIDTAGLGTSKPVDVRKERIRTIAKVLRSQQSTETEYEDALDALAELSKE